jgi:hypothetical protein
MPILIAQENGGEDMRWEEEEKEEEEEEGFRWGIIDRCLNQGRVPADRR